MVMPRPDGLDSPWVPRIIRFVSKSHVRLYQFTEGRFGGRWPVLGSPIFLVRTLGRSSKQYRYAPLIGLRDGERFIFVGSQGGQKKHPQWYKNLRVNPIVEVQDQSRKVRCRATTASPEEREELWPRLLEVYSDFESYQSWTDRVIPVVICTPEERSWPI